MDTEVGGTMRRTRTLKCNAKCDLLIQNSRHAWQPALRDHIGTAAVRGACDPISLFTAVDASDKAHDGSGSSIACRAGKDRRKWLGTVASPSSQQGDSSPKHNSF